MNATRQAEVDLLEAAARSLSEKGYQVFLEPSSSLLPQSLHTIRPDAVAIGRDPKLVIEVASERPSDAQRIAELQRILRDEQGWKLHLIFNRAPTTTIPVTISDAEIAAMRKRVTEIANVDERAALIAGWAALEALSRSRRPAEFARPQSPGRIVEEFASQGIITPSEASFLRLMAQKRNAFVHGDLRQSVMPQEIGKFVELLAALTDSPALRLAAEGRSP